MRLRLTFPLKKKSELVKLTTNKIAVVGARVG
jgi:hypothetical protein